MGKTKEPITKFKLKEYFSMPEIYTVGMLLFYSIFSLFFWNSIPDAANQLFLNFVIGVGIITMAVLVTKFSAGRIFFLLRRLLVVPIVYLIYSQVQVYIGVINPHDYDEILKQWDFAIFGVNPTEWISQIANPILTEYLQICYYLFFWIPIVLGVELHRRKDSANFDELVRIVMFSFFFSYICYLAMPAIGPRFSVHDFNTISSELPGLFFTESIRNFVNQGGGITDPTVSAAIQVNRDCMPSGHTWVTLVTMILAFKYNSKLRYVLLVVGSSLIFATIYLRYHYVVDVMAGISLALLSVWIEPKIRNYFYRKGFTNA